MLTIKGQPKIIMPYDWSYRKPSFFEASSIRKIKNLYYFIYAATDLSGLHYCTSRYPDREFVYRGPIHSSSDIGISGSSLAKPSYPLGNNHGSIVNINNIWYVFNHRSTNRSHFSRQGVAEKIEITENGEIKQVESTSCGLNNGPLSGNGRYPAYIACNLMGKRLLGVQLNKTVPYITQEGEDRESGSKQYISGIVNGSTIGFKYFKFNKETIELSCSVRGNAKGTLIIKGSDAKTVIAKLEISLETKNWEILSTNMKTLTGKQPLYFIFKGKGMLELLDFELT